MIVWAGSESDLGYQLIAAGTPVAVQAVSGSPAEVLAGRQDSWLGVACPPGLGALRAAESSDGLARAVGFADTLAFAGGLPGAFGFLSRVGGMVQAIRQACGLQYLSGPARIDTTGPVAWAALAALTQLRAERIDSAPDAMTGAVAHRLGITVSPVMSSSDISFDGEGFTIGDVEVPGQQVELYTAGAQIRLLTSKEPDVAAMQKACG